MSTNVGLPEELIEWGNMQPGGLSEFVRRLLQEAREKAEAEDNAKWDASFAATSDESLNRFADKIRADIAAGRTRPGGFGEE